MNLYEYQAKRLFNEAGLRIPEGSVVKTVDECGSVIKKLGTPVVLKAQIPTGDGGPQEDIKVANSVEEGKLEADQLFKKTVLGHCVKHILIEKKIPIRRQFYVGITIDVVNKVPVIIFGLTHGKGGEKRQNKQEDLFNKISIDPCIGLQRFQVRNLLLELTESGKITSEVVSIGIKLYEIFSKYGATLIEANPIVIDNEDNVWCGNARLSIDDNILIKLPSILKMIDENPDEFPQECIKVKYGFDYVELDVNGNVGLITTGAGLTMALVDELANKGVHPINFLDIRAGSLRGDPTRIEVVSNNIFRSPNINKLFINIFAGITDLEDFSKTFLKAMDNPKYSHFPKDQIIARIEGNNVEKGEDAFRKAGVKVFRNLSEAIFNLTV